MSNPLRHIDEAKATIAERTKHRDRTAVDMRGFVALEHLSDEATLIRAEMSAMRELLAMMQAKMK